MGSSSPKSLSLTPSKSKLGDSVQDQPILPRTSSQKIRRGDQEELPAWVDNSSDELE